MADQPLRDQILSFLKNHGNRAYRAKEISRALNITDNDAYQEFLTTLDALRDEEKVATAKGRRVQHRKKVTTGDATGTIRITVQGHGFVTLDAPDSLAGTDVFVRAGRSHTALDGDRVRVGLAADRRGRPSDQLREAEVLGVIERGRAQTVGTFTTTGRSGWVKPDDNRLRHDVYVAKEDRNGAEPGDKVVVSIDAFDDPKAAPEGTILQIIGKAGEPGVDVLALAMAHGAPSDFPKEVEHAAEKIDIGITKTEVARREDLRDLPIFTIDPVDAKDFDDAIHTRDLGDGMIEVGVHIADVSHYVTEGGTIDTEGYARATSTYLVDRVIPMLPEALSNGVCSLRPREDKLAYSCILTLDGAGNVHSHRFVETVIHSKERFTYESAQKVLDGKDHPLAAEVRRAGELAETLTRKRMGEGAIDFDVPEVRVVLGDDGQPVDIIIKERKATNRLVEEFMLLANRAVAEEASKRGKPLVYRIHDVPDGERIGALADYVRPFGYTLKHDGGTVKRAALNGLLKQVKGKPEAPVIEQAAIRSMSKAVYSPHNIGHYGLGFSHYAHFTSPIRRYPDLIVHRLMKQYVAGKGKSPDIETLESQARHCSEREREATEAERESIKLKQVEYAAQHLGDVFDGVVVGVTKFGVFVEMKAILTEGLVHVREMGGDYWEYDPNRYALLGRNTGRRIQTGDSCRVKIVAADPESRRIDLLFENAPGEGESARFSQKKRAQQQKGNQSKARQQAKQRARRANKKKRRR
ncbi:MAG: ribonuclease R [Rubricoccaceae bacterium]